jgi:hypothetical protein
MNTKIDSFTLINLTPPGTMIYSGIGFGNPEFETAILIKETPAQLRLFSENTAHIEINSCSILVENVTLILFSLQIDHNPNLTYAVWLDYYLSDTAKRCLNNLVTQDLLRVLFFNGAPKPVRGFSLKNKLQAGFGLYLQTLNNKAPWSMEDFEYAKNITLGQFPTMNSLWAALKEDNLKTSTINNRS